VHRCPTCKAPCDCDPGGPYPQTCRHICDDDLGDEQDYEEVLEPRDEEYY
jgi:hypothetical protein